MIGLGCGIAIDMARRMFQMRELALKQRAQTHEQRERSREEREEQSSSIPCRAGRHGLRALIR